MIYLSDFRNYKSLKCDENWAIVRSCKTIPNDVRQVQNLSPSTELFYKYLDLKNKGIWNQDSFSRFYLNQFIAELKENRKVTSPLLNYLYSADKNNKSIALICYCSDEALCHRSIIGGILQGVGVHVSTSKDIDCNKYYDIYCKI